MKIVYLHGVGTGDAEGSWLTGLNRGMDAIGATPVERAGVIAPKYAALLGANNLSVKHPPITYRAKDDRAASRAFHQRQAQVERRIRGFEKVRTFALSGVPTGLVSPIQTFGIDSAPLTVLKQVQNYLTDVSVRAAVLQQILDNFTLDDEEIILIGHSLGSVIAVDLLDHLPEQVRVRRFITIGSPAGNQVLHRDSERILKRFPYSRVDDWSNFLDPRDLVTAGRGLATIFPGAQDFLIDGAANHASSAYLSHRAVATLVAEVLHPPTILAPASSDIVTQLTDEDAASLIALEFMNATSEHIKNSDARERFEDAVAVLRSTFADEVLERGRPLAPELVDLVAGRLPTLPRRWDLQDAIAQVVVLAYSNLIAPHEIDTGEAATDAIPTVIRQLGYPSGFGRKVQAAVVGINKLLDERPMIGTKTRIAVATAGVVLLAAGPIGIAAAGAAGAAGAAAITSGLAAFGPGGMVGGLAMLGGLASTGGMVAAAAATVRPGGSAVVLDPTAIAIQVAIAKSLKDIGEPYDDDLWRKLTLAESDIASRINRIAAFSDPKAPSLKRLRAARDTTLTLMDYVRANKLIPEDLQRAMAAPTGDGSAGNRTSGFRVPWK